MAGGRIRDEDIAAIRERAAIDEVVGEHVALKRAGVGSLKGLCPFHEERSPSFNVRPQVGRFHCFGCGEGGDVIAFVMKIDNLPFTDAVERLAARVGVELRYVDDGGMPTRRGEGLGRRQRLVEANAAAAAAYREELASPEARPARDLLTERGFDDAAAVRFGVGYAPRSGDWLYRRLRARGFSDDELVTAGLVGRSAAGRAYDRFRGRLLWPIRDVTGDTVGFGARRLFDDDRIEAKYLNTPDTPLYRKAQVLYGVDLARRDIARTRRVVVVEGYTDVMACHLAGVTTAVATCGTAFGDEHARVLRRLLGDTDVAGEVVFTFDGDAAGRRAARRAFDTDQRFVARTSVAVEPTGKDPCELRQVAGDEAVQALVEARVPLFEFVIRSVLDDHDLDTEEGRMAALDAAAPIVAAIKDPGLRHRYAVNLDRWTGYLDERFVVARVKRASQAPRRPPGRQATGAGVPSAPAGRPPPPRGPADPVAEIEEKALACALQYPQVVSTEFDALGEQAFLVPALRTVHEAIRALGGLAGWSGKDLVSRVLEMLIPSSDVESTVTRLAVVGLPTGEAEVRRYALGMVLAVATAEATRSLADLQRQMSRLGVDADPDQVRDLGQALHAAQVRQRDLRERAAWVTEARS